MKRRRSITQEETESNIDLDLAPMLALMVALIPMMLLATVFVRVSVIETPLPQLVQKAIEEDRNKKDRDIQVLLNMGEKGDFVLQTKVDGRKESEVQIPRLSGEAWDFEKLHEELVKVKRAYPKIFRMDLMPDGKVDYKSIVQAMDEARKIRKGEEKFAIEDRETKKVSQTEIMFPDVTFADVVGG